jgi:hypothetical protein
MSSPPNPLYERHSHEWAAAISNGTATADEIAAAHGLHPHALMSALRRRGLYHPPPRRRAKYRNRRPPRTDRGGADTHTCRCGDTLHRTHDSLLWCSCGDTITGQGGVYPDLP